jgi:hypothetical protein
MAWWKHAHRHDHHGHEARVGDPRDGLGANGVCGPGDRSAGSRAWAGYGRGVHEGFGGHDPDGPFGGFGVRRPLRFLAYKLELEEAQVEQLASILNDLKTERAQGEVDHRRSTAGIAEAIAEETLDAVKLGAATLDRVKTAERLRDAVVTAIGRIHAMLSAEQRKRLAYLIRTGVISI